MCYLSPEGVVLGADSTSTYIHTGLHFYNHNQKLYELGQNSALAVLTWGLGGLQGLSHRTLMARLADDLEIHQPTTLMEVAQRWVDLFYPVYMTDPSVQLFGQLTAKAPHNPATPPNSLMRTAQEQQLFTALRDNLVVGFCLGGRVAAGRIPGAYSVVFDPNGVKPTPDPIPMGSYRFWGAPNMVHRLMFGYDIGLTDAVLSSGKWNGSRADLESVLQQYHLNHPVIPIRDAVDFVYSCIHSTIKALKFSIFAQVCGGPIEVAVITTDRPFRWVRHKAWDAAITDGEQG